MARMQKLHGARAADHGQWDISRLAKGKNLYIPAAVTLVVIDALLTFVIVARVPYTKIDWDAYMSQVEQFLAGERNYENMFGDTGPLVYPAGFLYIYAVIKRATNSAVFPAQILFGVLYLLNLAIILRIYLKAAVVPWWSLVLLGLSKRVHSLFVLRLFNDCVATTLAHASIALMQSQYWQVGLIIFSAAVSVKMNVLLYAPPLLLLLLKTLSLKGVLVALAYAALLQIILGLPFLLHAPMAYLSRAFNFGRVFIHYWSVNLKFVPETVFVSKLLALLLLLLHLGLLFLFVTQKWCKQEGGFFNALGLHSLGNQKDVNVWGQFVNCLKIRWSKEGNPPTPEYMTTVLFTGNFIGIVCARSLHYQFYCWYFFSLPLLLWKTPFPTPLRLALFATVELCWNTYPSSAASSLALLGAHLIILWGLWKAPISLPLHQKARDD